MPFFCLFCLFFVVYLLPFFVPCAFSFAVLPFFLALLVLIFFFVLLFSHQLPMNTNLAPC